MSHSQESVISFSGHDWENLNRLVALTKFRAIVDTDLQDASGNKIESNMCAWLAARFQGPALDWVATTHAVDVTLFSSFDGFVDRVRQAFGVAIDNIKALCQTKLDQLRMGTDVPVFFAEIDRLFIALSITGHDTRIAHVMMKLPPGTRQSLAEQGRQFHNYETMREFLNTRWALMPSPAAKTSGANPKRQKCSNCGRKGHDASACRKSKN